MKRKKQLDNLAAAMRKNDWRHGGYHPAKPWNAEQIAWVKRNQLMSRQAIADHMGCSLTLVFRRLRKLGLSYKDPRWTDEEDELLRSLAGTMPVVEIATRLGRGYDGIRQRATKALGLNLHFKRFWPDEAEAQLRRLIAEGKNTTQIADEMKRSRHSVRDRLRLLKLKARRTERPARPPRPKQIRATVTKPRPIKAELAPRERIGIPVAVRRPAIVGSLTWCDRCHAPVLDTPEGRAEHNQRVHTEPVFSIPGRNRRIA